jgi:hypothetical protein
VRDLGPQPPVALWVLEELDHLGQLVFGSSIPATSAKVVRCVLASYLWAFERPMPNIPPPSLIRTQYRWMIHTQNPTSRRVGRTRPSSVNNGSDPDWTGFAVTTAPSLSSSLSR